MNKSLLNLLFVSALVGLSACGDCCKKDKAVVTEEVAAPVAEEATTSNDAKEMMEEAPATENAAE